MASLQRGWVKLMLDTKALGVHIVAQCTVSDQLQLSHQSSQLALSPDSRTSADGLLSVVSESSAQSGHCIRQPRLKHAQGLQPLHDTCCNWLHSYVHAVLQAGPLLQLR